MQVNWLKRSKSWLLALLCLGPLALGLWLGQVQETWGQDPAEDSSGPAPADNGSLQGAPEPRKPGERGIGGWLPKLDELQTRDLSDAVVSLDAFIEGRIAVFAMTSTSCPASRRYQETLRSLVNSPDYSEVAWVIVDPIETDSREELTQFRETLTGRVLMIPDPQGILAATVGCLTTTDVTLVDASRTVRYRGAIDDQYGVGYALEAPRRRLLADALEATKAGKTPAIAATDAPGCSLDDPRATESESPSPGSSEVTYTGEISRLLLKACVDCHREGGVGPFPLTSYRDVVAHAAMIRDVVDAELMPPWFAAEESPGSKPAWANDRSLSAEEKRILLEWLDGSRPEGNPKDAPSLPNYAGAWTIGEPDKVFGFSEPVSIPATGTIPYRWVTVETNLDETRWVKAIEVMPGARQVVHHVLVFVEDPSDQSNQGRAQQDERSGFWAAYVPGNSSLVYPDGLAKRLPANAKLRFQMHYTPNGEATQDVTRLGVIFADGPPEHEVKTHGIANPRLSIPPGESNHREEASLRVPFDVRVIGFMPHMHVRGKACRYELEAPEGSETLLDVPRYDFNWQLLYRPFEPIDLTAGQTLRFVAWFDNSDQNPANPDPTREVRWGPQTFDEMHLGYIEYIQVDESAENNLPRNRGNAANIGRVFRQLDRNNNETLDREELEKLGQVVPRLRDRPQLIEILMNRADSDGNQQLTLDEFRAAAEAFRSTQE